MKLLKDVDVEGKRVFVRTDYNVLDKKGNLTDDYRIRKSLETINYLLENKAKQIILATHVGRPKGEVVPELKTDLIAKRLSELLGKDVRKLDDCIGVENEAAEGDTIILLENLRFHKEEKKNDNGFAAKLASLADIYVNDAFGASHRKHASVDAITKHLPSYAGLLVQKEIEVLTGILENPEKPMVVMLGGAKVSDKFGVINNLLKNADFILIGGAMAFTFFKAKGMQTGNSLVEEDKIDAAKELMESGKIVLPEDILIADKLEAGAKTDVVDADKIPENWFGADIGPKTVKLFSEKIAGAKTVVWNGPLGLFEIEEFANGTNSMAKVLADSDAMTVAGGGETIASIGDSREKISHVSTGGGAMLEFLEGKDLPAIKVLLK